MEEFEKVEGTCNEGQGYEEDQRRCLRELNKYVGIKFEEVFYNYKLGGRLVGLQQQKERQFLAKLMQDGFQNAPTTRRFQGGDCHPAVDDNFLKSFKDALSGWYLE
ncbi:hypothetical protein HPP92_023382 [Vanilla planifolia]|uniref:Uncharacterized protein n=1 Tax=Vanilla planifolia TaxID=51239 RepID=A0A835PQ91_VANPL|nr:hypothetical protein HPP92_023382 [Vanilla planifolia]